MRDSAFVRLMHSLPYVRPGILVPRFLSKSTGQFKSALLEALTSPEFSPLCHSLMHLRWILSQM